MIRNPKKLWSIVFIVWGVLFISTTQLFANTDVTTAFYDETSKACYAQLSKDEEVQKYKGMVDYVCPCMLNYLKAHYKAEDIMFMADYTIKKNAKTIIPATDETQYNHLLDVASESGKTCATNYFDASPSNNTTK